MIIVSGTLTLHPDGRDAFFSLTREVMESARAAPGCRAFVVTADPIERDLAIVYEEWATEDDLLTFRRGSPSPDLKAMIARADVRRHHIARSGPA
jgi:quinol monooxygenase YgiN